MNKLKFYRGRGIVNMKNTEKAVIILRARKQYFRR